MAKQKKKKASINRKKTISDDLKSNKKTERVQFCWNCFHADKKACDAPCDTCFGVTNTGQYFNYKNWREGIDYVD